MKETNLTLVSVDKNKQFSIDINNKQKESHPNYNALYSDAVKNLFFTGNSIIVTDPKSE